MRPVERVLDRLEGVRTSNDSWKAPCPAHADKVPSLSISEGDDGRALIKCFAGCETEDVLSKLGLQMKDLFPEANGRGRRGGSHPSGKGKCVNRGGAGCTLARYAESKRLPVEFLESLGVGEIPNYNGNPAVRFPYLSAEGDEVCIRFRVSLDGKPKVKTRRGGKHALYGLWRLQRSPRARPLDRGRRRV